MLLKMVINFIYNYFLDHALYDEQRQCKARILKRYKQRINASSMASNKMVGSVHVRR